MVAEKARRLNLLRAAAASFANRGLKKAINAWAYLRESRRHAMQSLASAGRAWVNRATMQSWRKLAHLGAHRRKARHAAASFVHRNLRKGLNGWTFMVAEKARRLALLNAAAASFANRGLRKGCNRWVASTAAQALALSGQVRAVKMWLHRAMTRAWNALKALERLRRLARRAGAAIASRRLRCAINAWVGSRMRGTPSRFPLDIFLFRRRAALLAWLEAGARRSALMRKMVPAVHAMRQRDATRALNCWTASYAERRRLLGLARRALLHSHRAAFNTWAGRGDFNRATFALMQRALLQWPALQLSRGLRKWIDVYTQGRAPPPPLHHRVRGWVRARRPRPMARAVRVPADDKLRCSKLLLMPFAALVVRDDGALLRVADVRRGAVGAPCCTLELVAGVDAFMLAMHPLPRDLAQQRAALGASPTAVSADELAPPRYPLVVPCFFGGVLGPLLNGLRVRIVDADFDADEPYHLEPQAAATDGAGLRHVKVSLVDGRGDNVGRPVWCDVHELLAQLPADAVVVPQCDSENSLREQRRLELHKAEQLRLALATMRAEGDAMDPSGRIPDDSMDVLGFGGLFAQVDLVAPSAMVEAGERVLYGGGHNPTAARPPAGLAASRQGSTESLRRAPRRPSAGSVAAATAAAAAGPGGTTKQAAHHPLAPPTSRSAAALLISDRQQPVASGVLPLRERPVELNYDGWGLRDL